MDILVDLIQAISSNSEANCKIAILEYVPLIKYLLLKYEEDEYAANLAITSIVTLTANCNNSKLLGDFQYVEGVLRKGILSEMIEIFEIYAREEIKILQSKSNTTKCNFFSRPELLVGLAALVKSLSDETISNKILLQATSLLKAAYKSFPKRSDHVAYQWLLVTQLLRSKNNLKIFINYKGLPLLFKYMCRYDIKYRMLFQWVSEALLETAKSRVTFIAFCNFFQHNIDFTGALIDLYRSEDNIIAYNTSQFLDHTYGWTQTQLKRVQANSLSQCVGISPQ